MKRNWCLGYDDTMSWSWTAALVVLLPMMRVEIDYADATRPIARCGTGSGSCSSLRAPSILRPSTSMPRLSSPRSPARMSPFRAALPPRENSVVLLPAEFMAAQDLITDGSPLPERLNEQSSGDRIHRGGITKTGNCEACRMLVDAAWSYRYPPRVAVEKTSCSGCRRSARAVRFRVGDRPGGEADGVVDAFVSGLFGPRQDKRSRQSSRAPSGRLFNTPMPALSPR
jgi:hypothetical protein